MKLLFWDGAPQYQEGVMGGCKSLLVEMGRPKCTGTMRESKDVSRWYRGQATIEFPGTMPKQTHICREWRMPMYYRCLFTHWMIIFDGVLIIWIALLPPGHVTWLLNHLLFQATWANKSNWHNLKAGRDVDVTKARAKWDLNWGVLCGSLQIKQETEWSTVYNVHKIPGHQHLCGWGPGPRSRG